jgi:hypothetical protein
LRPIQKLFGPTASGVPFADFREAKNQFWSQRFELLGVGGGKSPQHCFPARGKLHQNHSTVLRGRRAGDQVLGHQPIEQFHGAMVANLESFRQLSDTNTLPTRIAFDRQQSLMLLRCEASLVRRFFAEMKKAPERVTKSSQSLMLAF